MAGPIVALLAGKAVSALLGKAASAKVASLHVGGAKAHALGKAGDKLGDKAGERVTAALRNKPDDGNAKKK